ncbi:MAG: hypothetical protein NPIRA01_09680 [Nitrospirales bacterium]|nr:MAG: hypothetical protein NPIRA01_09680 [Nitrospirales bacterium]
MMLLRPFGLRRGRFAAATLARGEIKLVVFEFINEQQETPFTAKADTVTKSLKHLCLTSCDSG